MGLFKSKSSSRGRGLILFKEVKEALKAEKILKVSGYGVKLAAPPPSLRKGCDLAIEVDLMGQAGVERVLRQNGVEFDRIVSIDSEELEPLRLVKVTDFGDSMMVRAGNMKVAFEKATGVILNVSGGGCPDVPYLHLELLNKKITEAPRPCELGFTLCALMLDRALDEGVRIYEEARG